MDLKIRYEIELIETAEIQFLQMFGHSLKNPQYMNMIHIKMGIFIHMKEYKCKKDGIYFYEWNILV